MKRIPITAAKKISIEYNCPEVVIFAYDPETGLQHITTYGKSKAQCIDAAKIGNWLKRLLGWDADKCNAIPTRAKEQK